MRIVDFSVYSTEYFSVFLTPDYQYCNFTCSYLVPLFMAVLACLSVCLSRLSIGHKPPTLPDGVTMRDDPMTKTIAFLNSTPKLT